MYVLFGIKQSREGMVDVDNLLQKNSRISAAVDSGDDFLFLYITARPDIYCVVLYLYIELPLPL